MDGVERFPRRLRKEIALYGEEPGDILLDPFCETGASLIAAKQLGRRYIGCDLWPPYCRTVLRAAPCLFGLYTVVVLWYHALPACKRSGSVYGRARRG